MIEIRPEVRALFARWSEALFGAATVLVGIWLFSFGGWFYGAVGIAVMALGAGWTVLGVRRARFWAQISAAGLGPGLVEITEGQLRYLHPHLSGEISLDELSELHLAQRQGRAVWHLQDIYGQHLWVPVDAAGAGDLFDALGRLPGLSSADLSQLNQPQASSGQDLAPMQHERLIWRRHGTGLRKF